MKVNVKAEILKVGNSISFKGKDGEQVTYSPVYFLPVEGEPFTINVGNEEKVQELKKLERQTKDFVFSFEKNQYNTYNLKI